MSSNASAPPIVLIHGMWMTTLSWEGWVKHYEAKGHRAIAIPWPGLTAAPEELRRDPSPLRGLGIRQIVDHLESAIHGLDRPPIIVGHSFGGLFTQLLLDRGLGAAGVALDTAAPKGVLRLPYSTLRAAWPALNNPFNQNKDAPLTRDQFHWCFTNSLSREESDAVYDRYYIPGSARCFFQAATANLHPDAVTKVDFRNPARAPLLLVTGAEDRICPPSVNQANFKKQRRALSATEAKEYAGRCHYPGQDGWEEVADFVLDWTLQHARATAPARAEVAPEAGAATSPSG
ncbi:MAG TPA: alpha/beta fold hydrolase [Gaiellaceae bacterium]